MQCDSRESTASKQGEDAGELTQGQDGGGGRDGLSGPYADGGEASAKAPMLSLDQAEPSEEAAMEAPEGEELATQHMRNEEQEAFSQQLHELHGLPAQARTSMHQQHLLEEEMMDEMERTNQEALSRQAADRLVQALLHSHPALSDDAWGNAEARRVASRASRASNSYATARRVYGRGQAVALQSLPASRYTLADTAARLLEEVYFCHFCIVLEEVHFCDFCCCLLLCCLPACMRFHSDMRV